MDTLTGPPRRRVRSRFLGALVTTRPGRGLLLIVGTTIGTISLFQPSWAVDSLRDLAEEALLALGAGLAPAALWALALLLLLDFRPGALFRGWRLVLGSAALLAAAMGSLAYFRGELPLVGTANLGGEYGLTIRGDALSAIRIGAIAALGLWTIAPGRLAVVTLRLLWGLAQGLRRTGAGGAKATGRTFRASGRLLRASRRLQARVATAIPDTGRGRGPSAAEDTHLAKEVGSYLNRGQRTQPRVADPARQEETRSLRAGQAIAIEPSEAPQAPVQQALDSLVWSLPSTDLLAPEQEAGPMAAGEQAATAQLIEDTLAQHGLEVQVTEVRPGPTVTMFGLVPGWNRRLQEVPARDHEGNLLLDKRGKPITSRSEAKSRVKVDSILAREKDLTLALAAPSLRIEAPVPGESLVGVEVPNRVASLVTVGGILRSEEFQQVAQRKGLPIALGRGSGGEAVVVDLVEMPHLLIAGATGSGKSVCINSVISSLIAFQSPSRLQLLLVDPKRVELTPYNGIPHLATPVMVEPDWVVRMLKGAIQEMLRRYRLLEEAGVRNVQSYNRSSKATVPMPYLVICIDELADLMMASAYDVEHVICRLAQLGRATGIHLVVATQRPSVDVVTGLIKANFPSRISFAVATQVDSRTILDIGGAERLLGRGDMLFLAPDAPKPRRVQGGYISEEETDLLTDYWKSQEGPSLTPLPLEEMALQAEAAVAVDTGEDEYDGGQQDSLFDKASEMATRYNQLSTSLLQRRLRIGYPRAARLMDQLEQEGIVSPGEPGKPREVLHRQGGPFPHEPPSS